MESNAPVRKEANRLYWQTDRSVADIAGKLGVSRRALYELVEPETTAVACGVCGSTVVFANRSAKAAGRARCTQCGSECAVEMDVTDADHSVTPYATGWPSPAEVSADELRERAIKIGSVAFAGAAVGAVAAWLVLRRR